MTAKLFQAITGIYPIESEVNTVAFAHDPFGVPGVFGKLRYFRAGSGYIKRWIVTRDYHGQSYMDMQDGMFVNRGDLDHEALNSYETLEEARNAFDTYYK